MTSNIIRNAMLMAVLMAVYNAVWPIHASAADLRLPQMPAKAPPLPPATPMYNWSGLYVGGHLGYLWGRTRVDDDGVTVERNARTDGIIGGAMIGYNWQVDRVVFGLEGDIGWTNAQGVGSTPPPPPPPPTFIPVTTRGQNSYDVRWTSHIRGRLGYAFGDWLVFGAGGFAVADLSFREGAINTTFVQLPQSGGGTVPPPGGAGSTPAPSPQNDDGGKYYGWSIGGGIEHAFTANLVGRVEYFYDNYGHKGSVGALGDSYRVSLTGQTVRAALAWKFDPFGR